MNTRVVEKITVSNSNLIAAVMTAVLVLIALGAGVGMVTAQEQPGEPVNFYGDAEFEDGNPVPDGTTIVAVVNGEIEDSINVSNGQYGGPNTFDPKLTTGTGAGDEVSFHIGDASGPEAIESPVQLEAGTFEQNLTFPVPLSVGDITTQSNVDGEVAVLEQFDIEVPVENQGSQSQQVPVTIDANGTVLDETRNIAPGQTEITASTAVSFGFVGEDQGPAELNINADVENKVRSTSIDVYELGDATHSGAVGVADSTNVLQEIDPFAEPTADTFNPAAADVSRNDEVDVTDSIQILQIIDPFTDPPGYPPESGGSTVSTDNNATDRVQTQQTSPDGTFSVTDARGASGDSVTVTVSFTGDGDELAGYAYELGFDPAVIQPASDGFIVDTNAPVDQSSAGDDGVFVAGSEGENIGDTFSWTLAFDIVGDPGNQTSIDFGGQTQASDENSSVFDLTLQSGLVTVEEPANFAVQIDSTNSPVTEGDPVTVTTTIQNTGDEAGTQTITLDAGGLGTTTKQVSLATEESKQETFSLATASGDAGSYTATVSSDDDTATQSITIEEPAQPALEAITIELDQAVIGVGETTAATVTAQFSDGTTEDVTSEADIQSEDSAVASVTGATITGEGDGTATISATFTSDGVTESDTADITVEQPANFAVQIDSTNSPVTEGDPVTVTTTIENTGDETGTQTITLDAGGLGTTTKQVSLATEESKQETFSLATASGDAGSYTATVSSDDDTATQSITIEEPAQPALEAITIELDQAVIGVGETTAATVTAQFSDGTTEDVTSEADIQSEDSAVASVTGATITGEGDGTTTISATFTSDGVTESDTADITVEQQQTPANFAVQIDSTNSPVTEGDPVTVTATIQNTGDLGDTQQVELAIPGIGTTTVDVTLNGGQSTQETFSLATTSGDAGSYTATVSSDDDAATQSVTVQAVDPGLESLIIGLGESVIDVGETTEATVTAQFDDGSAVEVTDQASLSSLDSDIVSVNGATLTGAAEGTTTIEAEYTEDGVTETATATIEVAQVTRNLSFYAEFSGDPDIVETVDLLEAISDWRSDIIDTEFLLDVIDAWRSGEPVN